jgi:hypothetical protein
MTLMHINYSYFIFNKFLIIDRDLLLLTFLYNFSRNTDWI